MFNRKFWFAITISIIWSINVSLTFSPQVYLNITLNE